MRKAFGLSYSLLTIASNFVVFRSLILIATLLENTFFQTIVRLRLQTLKFTKKFYSTYEAQIQDCFNAAFLMLSFFNTRKANHALIKFHKRLPSRSSIRAKNENISIDIIAPHAPSYNTYILSRKYNTCHLNIHYEVDIIQQKHSQ